MAQSKESLYKLQIVVNSVCPDFEVLDVQSRKDTTSEELIQVVIERLKLDPSQNYDLAEVMVTTRGQTCKERRLEGSENPVAVQLLWPKPLVGIENDQTKYSFCLRGKQIESVGRGIGWGEGLLDFHNMDSFLSRFLHQPWNKEYPDLCNLPDLNEHTLLENLKARFFNGHIYTYVGSILIAVNPFKFYPIYNPKYVKLYQNRRLGELPPHIFAIADSAYHTMLRDRANQCIVISGESGSGKTESTNFLLHHLTTLSQKGHHGSGVEQTILGAGPVLEAFGNAKTAHNNNSSRFGKFIQVNYKENGMVHGAVVQKYLLEKSRIVSQAKNERNYHVFYYLLAGASEAEKEQYYLGKPEDYFYLNQSDCYSLSGVDENYEFARLKQSMEMVGFATETQKRLFCVLSAVLHLGNIQFTNRSTYYHDESVSVKNPDLLKIISNLLKVKEETLMSALTSKKTIARTETLVINYKMHEAIATRDALAKCLYGALFDWIVLQVNHALMAKKDTREHHGNSIGVLDIFGFENFENNSFEQFCINFANEHLQYYFNEHVFRFEQDEYKREGICWKNIDFVDNTGCLNLIEGRPTGLLSLIDEECNFPGGTNETLIEKFNQQHKNNDFYEVPQKRESAFIVNHYAGKVKYSTKDFREKNSDLMRPDIVSVLKNSSMSFVRELVGIDPVAVFRWAILRAFFRSVFVFINAGKQHRKKGANKAWRKSYPGKIIPANENMLSISKWSSPKDGSVRRPLASMHDNVPYELEGMCLHGVMTESQAKVFHRANRILMKHKSFKPKLKANKCLKDLQALKTLTGKSVARSSRKQPPTVGAQFQASLSKLRETLNQANPFFVRCMKSNSEKAPCKFDKDILLRQLRYTGMLETVRIRRCGYNVRLTFEEFIQVYRIILPRGLLSSRAEVMRFLERMNLNKVNYQLGLTKLFFRESEKVKLDEKLHMEIMHRIVTIQYWWKTILERRQFLRLKVCTIRIQSQIRCYLAQRKLVHFKMRVLAAIFIQKCWRGYCCQRNYQVLQRGVIWVQRIHRGNLARQRYWLILEDRRQQQKRLETDMDLHSSQSDEGILTKENSQEELSLCYRPAPAHDSEESSGILDDSETESMASESHHQPHILGLTPPISPYSEHNTESPPSPHSPVEVRPYSTSGEQIVPRRRVSEMTKAFSTGTTEEKTKKTSKKTSAKKMKPIKSPSSDALYTQDKTVDPSLIRRQTSLTENHQFEENENSLKILPSNLDQREVLEKLIKERESSIDSSSSTQRSPVSQHKGRFHKARQHLKTFIGGGKKPMKRPTCVTDDSEDSQTEDQICPSLKNSHDVGVLPVESVDEQSDAPEIQEEPLMKDMHSFKHAKFHKGETCNVCCKNFIGLFTQGSKCIVCKLAYHQKCMQNAGRCLGNKTSPRVSPKNNRKVRKHSKTSLDMKSPKKWNLTGTSEFTDRADQIISDVNELRSMDNFIFSKITCMSQDGRRDTIVDVVFKTALKEFHRHLVSTYSVAAQVCQTDGNLSIKYKDLIVNFEQTMATVCKQKNTSATFPVTMGINAFRGFLDEFMNLQKVDDKPKYKTLRRKRKEDKKKGDTNMEHLGHNFMGIVMNIPTACEYCSSFMWLMEKGMVCHSCKLTCHKKCCNKVILECRGFRSSSEVQEDYQFRIFRVPLSNLVSEDIKIPLVVEKLISSIELKGLYTEGIYRKSGSNAKVKLLRLAIDNDLKNLNLDLFAVHVLTTTLKLFFREMPESLMTYDLYDDFLRASDLTDSQERIRTFYSIIQKLPKCNHNLLERLIFHLARVAQHEEANRMSANSLAIVFAPCILRTNKQVQAQDSLNDVSRQTMCVEVIIEEQLRKLKATLEDIDTLESATATASNRLSTLRSSKIFLSSQLQLSKIDNIDDTGTSPNEEEILSEHIRSLEQEKALLTTNLPRLTRNSSDDDMISGDDLESTFDSIMDEMEEDVYEEYALTFDLPVSPPTALRHLNKHRADVPIKRKPSRFSYYNILSSQHDSIPSDTTIVSIYHPASDLYEDDVIMV